VLYDNNYSWLSKEKCAVEYKPCVQLFIMQKFLLLVDDDEEEYYIMCQALELAQVDFTCAWANGAEQALHMVKESPPDFIFIDINMPRIDGLTCLKKLKQVAHLQQTLFVMYSTYISEINRKKAIATGAIDCISKPGKIQELVQHLVQFFNDETYSPV